MLRRPESRSASTMRSDRITSARSAPSRTPHRTAIGHPVVPPQRVGAGETTIPARAATSLPRRLSGLFAGGKPLPGAPDFFLRFGASRPGGAFDGFPRLKVFVHLKEMLNFQS